MKFPGLGKILEWGPQEYALISLKIKIWRLAGGKKANRDLKLGPLTHTKELKPAETAGQKQD